MYHRTITIRLQPDKGIRTPGCSETFFFLINKKYVKINMRKKGDITRFCLSFQHRNFKLPQGSKNSTHSAAEVNVNRLDGGLLDR